MPHEDNGWENSADAWIRDMDAGAPARVHLLDPVMLDLCAPRLGLRALDVGCGEGRFCRLLRERGVEAIGLDPTEKLLLTARQRDPQGDYRLAGAEALPFSDAEFDIVVSYLVLIDIPDFRTAIAEMARVLRPGGRLVVANLTSMSTATYHLWWRDENGEKLFWTVDDYMTERPAWAEWRGIRIVNWHRPLSAYMQAFLANGLRLEAYDEPMPTNPEIAASPDFQGYGRRPDFLTMCWTKT